MSIAGGVTERPDELSQRLVAAATDLGATRRFRLCNSRRAVE